MKRSEIVEKDAVKTDGYHRVKLVLTSFTGEYGQNEVKHIKKGLAG